MPEDTTCATIPAPDQAKTRAMIPTTTAAITPEHMTPEDQLCLLSGPGPTHARCAEPHSGTARDPAPMAAGS